MLAIYIRSVGISGYCDLLYLAIPFALLMLTFKPNCTIQVQNAINLRRLIAVRM